MFADTPTQDNALATAASELALALDLDFLPERYRPRRLTLRSLRPALFVLGFALLLIPLGRFWGEARLQLAAVEGSLTQVQADLQGYQPLAEERAGLEARIASAQAASAEIQIAYDSVDIQDITWNRVLSRALSVRPEGVEVVRLSHEPAEQDVGIDPGETRPVGAGPGGPAGRNRHRAGGNRAAEPLERPAPG